MSGYDEEEENRKTVKHKIELSTSDRERELQDKLENALVGKGDAEAKMGIYAMREFSRLKNEAKSLGITSDVIDAIQDPEDLEKIVYARKNPDSIPATPENKNSGGSGFATLGRNYHEDGSQTVNPSMPNESASVEEWENFFEQKLIKQINDLRGRGLSGDEIARRSVEKLAEWNLSVIKPKGLILHEKSNLRKKQERALDNLTNKIFQTIQNQEKIKASRSEW